MTRRGAGPLRVGTMTIVLLGAGLALSSTTAAADGGSACDGHTLCLTVNARGTYVQSVVMTVSVPGGPVGGATRNWCGGVQTTSTDGRQFARHLCAGPDSPSSALVNVNASVPGGTTFCMEVTTTDPGSTYTPDGKPCLTVR